MALVFFKKVDEGIQFAEAKNLKFLISANGKHSLVYWTDEELDRFCYNGSQFTVDYLTWLYKE